MRPLAALLLAACGPPAVVDAGPLGGHVAVEKIGDGRGTVRSRPAGLLCDIPCERVEHDFAPPPDAGTAVLVFEPARDAQFLSWSCAQNGAAPVETTELEIGVDVKVGDSAVCTVESRRIVLLDIVRTGTGSGDVVGTITGQGASTGLRVDCGDDCQGAYFVDEVETLTAVPDASSQFIEWKLDCLGTTTSIDITMDDEKTCEAVFDLL